VGAAFVLAWTAVVFACYWPAFRVDSSAVVAAFAARGLTLHAVDVAAAWGTAGRAALTAAAILLAIRGAGCAVARVARATGPAWLAAIPLGLGVVGALGLGLGLLGLLQPPLLVAAVVALAAAGGVPRDLALFPAGTPRWAVGLAGLVALAALPGALVPEVTYDALAYHLGAPGLFLGLHRIVRLDHMMFTDFPLAVQMSYLFALASGGGDLAAKLLSFAFGLGTIGVAAHLGARLGGKTAAGWAAVCMASTPMLATQMAKANVDLGVALPAAAGAWWLLGRRASGAVVVAGLLLGCAAAAKLTGGYAVVAGAAVLLLADRSFPARRPSRAASVSLLLAAAAVPLAPWLAKTWLATGNPVYPFAWAWFGGLGWSAANAAAYAKDMSEANSFNLQYPDVWSRLAAPWRMIMHDRGSAAAFGPVALALLPAFLWFRAPAHRAAARLGLFAAAGWLCWAVSARDPRFVLPLWPAVCALAGVSCNELPGRAGTAVRWAVAAAALATVPFVASEIGKTLNPGAVLWGAVPRDAYAEFLLPPSRVYVPTLRVAGAAAGRDSLLVVGDVKAPFVRARAWYASMFDTPPLEAWVTESGSASRLSVRFRQHRISCVFFHQGGAAYLKGKFGPYTWTLRDRAVLRAFWERRLEPVREVRPDGALLGVYRVVPPRPRARPLPMPGDTP
jgi:4-amino-4-deoxy-L-arabinose transferase-like glycosyltransferase